MMQINFVQNGKGYCFYLYQWVIPLFLVKLQLQRIFLRCYELVLDQQSQFCEMQESQNTKFDTYNNKESRDSNPLYRYLHIHCFIHMYKVLKSTQISDYFTKPRFPLFKRIERLYHRKQENNLFYNLIFTFFGEIVAAVIITIIYASLNLLVPQLIREFMQFMKQKHLEKKEYGAFIQKFLIVQFLRIFFSEHSKRLFHEIAIKVESTLARKLISKSLRMASQIRDKIPQSQIIQLQNVDLKLIFTLFQNMNIIFEAPFTIIVAIILLFNESSQYGFIGVYWFLIAFLLQRQLDSRMAKCNQTKLKLIEERSNLNYELFDKIKEAKLIGWQDLILQKNNDLFIHENQDHNKFYGYATYYDITLLMLPIFVVFTITLYDTNETDPITVEQVYLMLSLLGICYNPMKSIRTITINFHDGLHSLTRISRYFHLPEESKTQLIEKGQGKIGQINIQQGTQAFNPHSNSKFRIQVNNFPISIQPGQRLTLLGKRGSGRSSFLHMLIGNMKRDKGKIFMNGKVVYLPQKLFFLKDTVRQNIRFLDNEITEQEIDNICHDLGITQQLQNANQLDTMMEDTNKFTKTLLKKIALARILCSKADIFILDRPFLDVQDEVEKIVEKKLRQLLQNDKTVVVSQDNIRYSQRHHHILILEHGRVLQFNRFSQLITTIHSKINLFLNSQEAALEFLEPQTGRIQKRFEQNSRSIYNFDLKSARSKSSGKAKRLRIPNTPLAKVGLRLKLQQRRLKMPANQHFQRLLLKFLMTVPFKQIIYIFFIILAAEVLHIFIHFYIGHLEEQFADATYQQFKNYMATEVVLTFCLAGLIFLEGEISSIVAIIIGNKLYQKSFKQFSNKRLSWYGSQYSVILANRFNHDYQEIFIACHRIFGIYKNMVILIATIEFISTNRSKLIGILIFLISIYYSIFHIFRKIERKIVRHYYDYKYSYVRTLEECIKGATLFNVSGLKQEMINRAEKKYQSLASYKLAESYTAYALSLTCDILSITLLTIGIEYGIEMKLNHRQNRISIIATSIFLLMNISQVLKTIIRQMLSFQTFFSINVIPFMEIGDKKGENGEQIENQQQANIKQEQQKIKFRGHQLQFKNVLLEEPGQVFKINNVFSLVIPQGQVIFLYEKETRFRDLLLYALTKNLPMFNEPAFYRAKSSTIRLGGVNIRDASRKQWHNQIGVINSSNFFYTATIRQNLNWRSQKYNEQEALHYAHMLRLQTDIPDISTDVLSVKLTEQHKNVYRGLLKKIALIRILLNKPKVVIIKDTNEFIEAQFIVDILQREIKNVTIIKISNLIEYAVRATRIVALNNLQVIEQGNPQQIKKTSFTTLADQLRDINVNNYLQIKKNQLSFNRVQSL